MSARRSAATKAAKAAAQTADEAHVAFARLAEIHGRPGPTAKRLNLQAPVADDGETDCWTHAWEVARATGGTYVEGLCHRPGGSPAGSTHAWVEEDGPLGPVVVECTPGYEDATNYRGIPVDCTPGGDVDKATRGHFPRSSVIQLALASGFTAQRTLAMVRPR